MMENERADCLPDSGTKGAPAADTGKASDNTNARAFTAASPHLQYTTNRRR